MFFLVSDLYAFTGGKGGSFGPAELITFGAIFVIFFLLVIRPQQKKVKVHRQMVDSLQKGDQVVTSSGIYGKINKYFDDKDFLMLEIAEKTIVKVQKSQITNVIKSKATKENPKLDSEKKS